MGIQVDGSSAGSPTGEASKESEMRTAQSGVAKGFKRPSFARFWLAAGKLGSPTDPPARTSTGIPQSSAGSVMPSSPVADVNIGRVM